MDIQGFEICIQALDKIFSSISDYHSDFSQDYLQVLNAINNNSKLINSISVTLIGFIE